MVDAVPIAVRRDGALPYVFADRCVELEVPFDADPDRDAAGDVERPVDAGLVLRYYRMACGAAGHGSPNVIVN